MDKVKLLHCADLHLGSEISNIPERSGERRREILRTFRQITEICMKEHVDILLIAGDLFEGANRSSQVTGVVQEYLSMIRSRVFIAPGNHDYLALDSPYLEPGWPDHVTIFKGKGQRVDLPDLNVTVHGGAFESTYVSESLLGQVEAGHRQCLHIGVFHGDVVRPGQSSLYHAVTTEDIAASGLDYLALGHIHKRSPILWAGPTAYAYPGCPDGRGFDETGEKGVYLGTIGKGEIDLKFVPTFSRLYLTETLDVSHVRTQTGAEEAITTFLRDRYGSRWSEHFYRIHLTGRLEEGFRHLWPAIEAKLAETIHYIRLIDDTTLSVDLDETAKETSLKGIFVRRMLEKMAGTEDPDELKTIGRALEYGMEAFAGEVKMREDH